jgi:hypothetical protein
MAPSLPRAHLETGSRKFANVGHHTHQPDEAHVMRDNPIHTFFQVLGGNIPGQLSLGGFRWFEVVLYCVLLIGSLAIAYANWRLDSTQRTGTRGALARRAHFVRDLVRAAIKGHPPLAAF